VDSVQVCDGEYPLLYGRVRGYQEIVLIHSHGVGALGGEYSDDLEWNRVEAYYLA
jgi:hypothetical protein